MCHYSLLVRDKFCDPPGNQLHGTSFQRAEMLKIVQDFLVIFIE